MTVQQSNTQVTAIFHVDLSDAHPGETYWLHANGQRFDLAAHDSTSRTQARAQSPELATVPDEQLSHFTANPVALPGDQVIRVHIKHSLRTFPEFEGDSGSYHAYIHIPPVAENAPGELETTVAPPVGGNPPPPFHHHINWIGTAKALIFHHPGLITHTPAIAKLIFAYMDENLSKEIYQLISNPSGTGLADRMRALGPPAAQSGWAHLEPVKVAKNGINKTYYQQKPIPAIVADAGPVMTAMLVATRNDMALKNKKWYPKTGQSVVDVGANAPQQALASINLRGDDWRASLTQTGENYGLKTEINVIDAKTKTLNVTMQNFDIRYLAAYISFFDANGQRMDTPDWKPGSGTTLGSDLGLEYKNLKYFGLIQPVSNIFAVIIKDAPGILTETITFPEGAVKAEVYGYGLGTGADNYPLAPVIGGIMTGVVNLGIPAILLGFAVASQSNKSLYKLMSKPLVKVLLVAGLTIYYGQSAIRTAASYKRVDWYSLTSFGQIIFNQGLKALAEWVGDQIIVGEAEDEIPFAGWMIIAVNIASTLAQLGETIEEVASSPWGIANTITTEITSTLTVHPDPRHKAWPQAPAGVASRCEGKLIYKNQARSTLVNHIDLAADYNQKTIEIQIDKNTLGHEVKFEADYYVGDWLAASASTAFVANNAKDTAQVTLYLVEIPIPITDKSIYRHSNILTYNDNAYQWRPSAQAPTATLAATNTESQGNAISEWSGLSLSQRYASLGLSWKAAGTGLANCVNGSKDTQLYAMQNINIPGRPMSNNKFVSCGFAGQSELAYDVYPPKFEMKDGQFVLSKKKQLIPEGTNLGDFYVDPRKAAIALTQGGGYHLRKITLSGDQSFDLCPSDLLSFGRFPFYPDHLTLHPSGHVIGVSQKFAKIMILKLAEQGLPDQDIPVAPHFAGQALNDQREGLLFQPLAVSCSYDGTILILDQVFSQDQSVARIQAFDLNGSPVPRFGKDGSLDSAILPLPNDVTYLDLVALGNQSQTLMYLLYYENQGLKPQDYHLAIYQYGKTPPPSNPLVTTKGVPAARIQVDMWHTLYTLNYAMVTNDADKPAGPKGADTGPAGRTVPSVSEWMPPEVG